MNLPPLNTNYENSIQTLNELIRRAIDGTITNSAITVSGDITISDLSSGIVFKDIGGSAHTCRLQALYDSTTNNWIIVTTPIS